MIGDQGHDLDRVWVEDEELSVEFSELGVRKAPKSKKIEENKPKTPKWRGKYPRPGGAFSHLLQTFYWWKAYCLP